MDRMVCPCQTCIGHCHSCDTSQPASDTSDTSFKMAFFSLKYPPFLTSSLSWVIVIICIEFRIYIDSITCKCRIATELAEVSNQHEGVIQKYKDEGHLPCILFHAAPHNHDLIR